MQTGESLRQELDRFPKVKEFVASTKLPSSLVGLLLCREEKWTGLVQEDLFIKGYADKVFHVHIHLLGDNNEIAFRDYLRLHPAIGKKYECLKMYFKD